MAASHFPRSRAPDPLKLVRADSVVVKAVAQSSGSGIVRKIRIDPRHYPLLCWRWKIDNVLLHADVTRQEKDDAPAPLRDRPRMEQRGASHTVVDSPYSSRIKVIAVENGAARQGSWTAEERNVHEEYKAVFDAEPPLIQSVALMTDTDVTHESATAYFGDIRFRKAP